MEDPRTTGFWLSPQQRRVWTLQPDGCAHRCSCLVLIEGNISPDVLGQALRQLIARHETLRTVYRRQPGMKFPFQIVLDNTEPSIEMIDLTARSESDQRVELGSLFRQEQVPASRS